jgi:hypothetical protein
MGVIIISTLQRGAAGTAPFPITTQDDAKLPHVIVADTTARDAIPEWKRLAFMTAYSIADDKTYQLGVDVTIAGQVWTDIGNNSDFQLLSEKNQPSGYVGLNAEGFVDPQYIKSIYVQDYFTVADEAERLALVAVTGDIAYQLDNNQVYIKKNNNTPPTTNADWADITPTALVSSVNGQTGAVSITINGLLSWLNNTSEFNTAVGNAPAILGLNSQVSVNASDIALLYSLLSAITGEADSLPVYDAGTQYAIGNVVLYDAGSGTKNLYRCTVVPAIGTAPTNIAYWEIIGDFYTQAEIDAMMALKADLVGGKVPLSQLDLPAINKMYVVADQPALVALQPSLTEDDRVLVMEAIGADFPDGGAGEYVYKPGDPNADGLGYVTLAGASSKPFDWDRPIKKVPVAGVTVGGESVVAGLEEMLFGPVYPTIELSDIDKAQVGSSAQAAIVGTVTPNDVDSIDEIRIIRQSDSATLTTVAPVAPPANTPISYSAPAVTMIEGATESYYVEVDYTVGAVSGTITSDLKAFAGVYPILVGNGASGLTGAQIYALNKVLTGAQNTYYDQFSGTERLYFAFPDTYDPLVSIVDQHKDELFGSLFTDPPVVVSIPSTGLVLDWNVDYKVYETNYNSITANERFGFLFEYESQEATGYAELDPAYKLKLDSIETGAEVNPTAAEIKTLYESNANTNEFDDGEKVKLAGIEAGAEVNQDDATIKIQYENNADTNAFTDAYKAQLDGLPAPGDMQKSVYDDDDDGVVERAMNQEITVLNTAGVILPKGTAVYVNGYSSIQDKLTVVLSDRTLNLPANGIMAEEVAVSGTGRMIIQGILEGINTDGTPLDTVLYLDTTGNYTAIRPTEGIIQPVALVAYEDLTDGILYIGLGSVFQPTLEEWRANTFYTTGNLVIATDPYALPAANKKFYRALQEFTSSGTFDPQRVGFDLDWEVAGGDMSVAEYDTQQRSLVDYTESNVLQVINNTGGTLTAGTLVYITGYDSVSGKIEIIAADPVLFPAIGMLIQDLDDTEEGLIVTKGVVYNLNTSAYSASNTLYLDSSGGFTNTPPTTGLLQKIGYVMRDNATEGKVMIEIEKDEIQTQENIIQAIFSVTGGTSNKISHGPILLIELDQSTTYSLPLISGLSNTDYRVDLKNISGGDVTIQGSGGDTIEGDASVQLVDGENITLYMKTTEYKIL